MEEEAAGTRLDVQRRLSDGCHAPLSRYRLQRHLVIGPHRPAAIASLNRRSMAASRGLLISLKKRSSRQLLLDGRQTAPYSPAPDSDHILRTRKRLNHRTCRKGDFSGG